MADDSCSFDFDAEYNCVAIAVGCGGDDAQAIAGSFAFHPKLVAGAAEESYVALFKRAVESFAVHESEHQDFSVGRILHDRGKQAAHFFEVEFCIHFLSSSGEKQKAR